MQSGNVMNRESSKHIEKSSTNRHPAYQHDSFTAPIRSLNFLFSLSYLEIPPRQGLQLLSLHLIMADLLNSIHSINIPLYSFLDNDERTDEELLESESVDCEKYDAELPRRLEPVWELVVLTVLMNGRRAVVGGSA